MTSVSTRRSIEPHIGRLATTSAANDNQLGCARAARANPTHRQSVSVPAFPRNCHQTRTRRTSGTTTTRAEESTSTVTYARFVRPTQALAAVTTATSCRHMQRLVRAVRARLLHGTMACGAIRAHRSKRTPHASSSPYGAVAHPRKRQPWEINSLEARPPRAFRIPPSVCTVAGQQILREGKIQRWRERGLTAEHDIQLSIREAAEQLLRKESPWYSSNLNLRS